MLVLVLPLDSDKMDFSKVIQISVVSLGASHVLSQFIILHHAIPFVSL